MSSEVSNKLENSKFTVGDTVQLKSSKVPSMVVSEVFVDEKITKTLTKVKDSSTKEVLRIRDIGTVPIRVKCIWFYDGKPQEKVFWHDVLKKKQLNSIPIKK